MPTNQLALTLGNVTFADMEVPEEIDHFGGTQSMAIHKFPGGIITIQEFGAFPPENIRWSGILMNYNGVDLFDRLFALDQMRISGEQQTLTFGRFSYHVVVRAFTPRPRNIFMVPYTIEVVPFMDLTQSAITPPSAPSQVAQIQQQNYNLQTTIANAPTPYITPAEPYQVTIAPDSTTANEVSAATEALSTFQQSLSNALQQALGQPGLINTPALQGQLNDALAATTPLNNSNNPSAATFALQATATVNVISGQLNPVAPPLDTINVVNPNLQNLAEQYYGDASEWTSIASANQLMSPLPIGMYQLIIPQLTQ